MFKDKESGLLNLFFPDGVECVLCDQLLYHEHHFLCKSCYSKFDFITGKSCDGCGKSLPNTFDGAFCSECMGRELLHKHGLACVTYDEFSAEVIWHFKYHHKRYIGRMMGASMAELLKASFVNDIDLIIPVPIYRKKQSVKGYNHSGVLAEEIGKSCEKKVIQDFLIRKKPTKPLKDLTKDERILELENVFEINAEYKMLSPINRRILLVDDIFTTGTTVKECCKVLNGCGYHDIIVMTFATGNM